MDKKEIKHNFTHHSPSEDQIPIFQEMRSRGEQLAQYINIVVPDSREKSLALTKIEEAIMWANAGIARNNTKENE